MKENLKDGPTFWCFAKNFVKVQKTLQFHEIYLKCPKVGPLFEFFSQFFLATVNAS